jgi:hypothetical protein
MNGKRAKSLRAKALAKEGAKTATVYEDKAYSRFIRIPPHVPFMFGEIDHPKFGRIIPYQVYTREMVSGFRLRCKVIKQAFKKRHTMTPEDRAAYGV